MLDARSSRKLVGFKDEATAEKLARLVRETRVPSSSPGIGKPGRPHKSVYLVEAKEAVTRATTTTNGVPSIPGSGIVWVLERSLNSDDHELVYWEVSTEKVELRAFNLTQREYPIGYRGLAIQDADGDLYLLGTQWTRRLKGKITETGGITAGGSGEVTIWRNGAATTETVIASTWIDGGQDFSENKKVIVEWDPDEADGAGEWFIADADCE